MTYAGADGSTAQEMADVFHYPAALADLHGTMNSLDQQLYKTPEYMEDEEGNFKLNVANALWGQAGYAFKQDYLDEVAAAYGAGLKLVDYIQATEASRKQINDWVEKETEEKIKDLLPAGSLNADTRLVLTNAIYFNAAWLNEFNENSTRPEDFYLLNGDIAKVDMMIQEERFRLFRNEEFQAVQMPYFNANYSMILLMPKVMPLNEWMQGFSAADYNELLGSLYYGDLILSVPKFEYEDAFSVKDSLRTLGMPTAFIPGQANFSKMYEPTEEPFSIGDVLHKAYVAIDEEGTEAAAATAVIMEAETAMEEPPKPIPLVFDHPFLFLIQERETGIILFMGEFVVP